MNEKPIKVKLLDKAIELEITCPNRKCNREISVKSYGIVTCPFCKSRIMVSR